jgi:stress-induced-phosphoprotein 1
MGNAYMAQKKYGDAIDAYQKSLLEEKNNKAAEQLKKAQDLKSKSDREAYVSPALSLEHKTKGNALFNEAKYVEAISEYDEAVKRDPTNPTNYSNRAACFQKLMDWYSYSFYPDVYR